MEKLYVIILIMIFSIESIYSQNTLTNNAQLLVDTIPDYHRRNGLPNIFWKIQNRRQIEIAYIGGSITAAGDGWRELTYNWFRITYPHQAFYHSNAAIGGTGSVLGVFRMDDLLKEKPDLIFVEFAVNDENPTAEKRRINTIEGIVRKTWEVLPETDIIFVYTTAVKFMEPFLETGKRMDAVLDHERVAEHYGIPSVDMGLEVARLLMKDSLLLSADPSKNAEKIVFFKETDHYHPLQESGHPIYASTVIRYLEQMRKENNQPTPHVLIPPLRKDNWQNGKIISPGLTQLSGDWEKVPEEKKDQYGLVPQIYTARSGAVLEFKFKGDEIGFYDIVGPLSGTIEVEVDGKTQKFDRYYDRNRREFFFLDKMENGIHEVKVTVTGNKSGKPGTIRPGQDSEDLSAEEWNCVGVLLTGELK